MRSSYLRRLVSVCLGSVVLAFGAPALDSSAATAAVSRIVISPQDSTVVAGFGQRFTATAYDAQGAVIGDYTDRAAFSIALQEGESEDEPTEAYCNANVCGASRPELYTVTATYQSFTDQASLDVTPGPAVATPVSGSGQSARTGAAFAAPLVVEINDRFGGPVQGVPVTFTVTSGSASFAGSPSATVTTDTDGLATSPTLTAGATAGQVEVTAVSGNANTTFTETVVSPGPPQPAGADLKASVHASSTVPAGHTLDVSVEVTNLGTVAAGRFRAVLIVPRGFTLNATGGGVRFGPVVVFSGSGLAVNVGRIFTMTVTQARTTRGTVTFRGAAASVTRDPSYTNNIASTSVRFV